MYVAVLGIQDDSRLYVEAWRALSVLKGKTMPFNGNNLLWGKIIGNNLLAKRPSQAYTPQLSRFLLLPVLAEEF